MAGWIRLLAWRKAASSVRSKEEHIAPTIFMQPGQEPEMLKSARSGQDDRHVNN